MEEPETEGVEYDNNLETSVFRLLLISYAFGLFAVTLFVILEVIVGVAIALWQGTFEPDKLLVLLLWMLLIALALMPFVALFFYISTPRRIMISSSQIRIRFPLRTKIFRFEDVLDIRSGAGGIVDEFIHRVEIRYAGIDYKTKKGRTKGISFGVSE